MVTQSVVNGMLSIDVAEAAKKLSPSEKFHPIFEFISHLSRVAKQFPYVVGSGDSNAKQGILNTISNISASTGLWETFESAKEYKNLLLEMSTMSAGGWVGADNASEKIDNVLSSYEQYLKTRNAENALALAWNAHVLDVELKGMIAASSFFSSLIDVSNNNQHDDLLCIRLDLSIDFRQVESMLRACVKSYDLICELIEVSVSENPLELIKIESGSFMAVVKGFPKSISILRKFLEGYAKYAMISKRISDTEVSAKAIQSQLALKKSLEDHGIPTGQIGAELAEAAAALAKQTKNLIGCAETININGTFVSLIDDGMKLLSQERRLLEHDGQQDDNL